MATPKSTKLLDIAAKLVETHGPKTALPKQASSAPQASLPPWPENVRGIPNAILRGALFSVSQRRPMFRKTTLLASVDGIQIRFKGEGFNQTDLDVYETLLHLAREQPVGGRVEFTAHSLLKMLGRGTGKTQHEQLKDEIRRLAAGLIEITGPDGNGGRVAVGDKLVKYGRHERTDGTHRYVVIFDKDLLTLYEAGYTHIDWNQRQALTTSLAKWLHSYYATHAAPYPHKVETLKDLCGSSAGRIADFRRAVRVALDELKEIGAIKEWKITPDDKVEVRKVPTKSQQRHLLKRVK